jgi:hypothetical protein
MEQSGRDAVDSFGIDGAFMKVRDGLPHSQAEADKLPWDQVWADLRGILRGAGVRAKGADAPPIPPSTQWTASQQFSWEAKPKSFHIFGELDHAGSRGYYKDQFDFKFDPRDVKSIKWQAYKYFEGSNVGTMSFSSKDDHLTAIHNQKFQEGGVEDNWRKLTETTSNNREHSLEISILGMDKASMRGFSYLMKRELISIGAPKTLAVSNAGDSVHGSWSH